MFEKWLFLFPIFLYKIDLINIKTKNIYDISNDKKLYFLNYKKAFNREMNEVRDFIFSHIFTYFYNASFLVNTTRNKISINMNFKNWFYLSLTFLTKF